MGLSKKLTLWQQAGLISAEQGAAIAHYEQTHKSGRFMKGLIGTALFAILCGVLSIIAANWADIPASIKIGTHGIINALVAYVLWHADTQARREGLCLLLFGLTLTFIILVGQVFQLNGGWAGALMLWLIITAPLMVFYGHTRMTAIPWMAAFLSTVVVVAQEYLDPVAEFWGVMFGAGIAIFLPMALIADGNIRAIQRLRPVWSDVFIHTGFVLLVIMASGASFFWYGDMADEFSRIGNSIQMSWQTAYLSVLSLFALAFVAQGVYAGIKGFYAFDPDEKAGALIAFIALIFMALPVAVANELNGIGAALHLIIFWLLIGWIAQDRGWYRLVSLSILIITIRIFIIYCELFGSLMLTGVGLISGGVVMLGLIWLARKLNKRLKVMA